MDLTEQGEIPESEEEASHLADLESRLEILERHFKMQMDKNVANDLMFARGREEADAGTNRAKEDRIVVNGLTSTTPLPTEMKPRIEALKDLVNGIFQSIIPDFQGKIVYLNQGKHLTTPLPMVEVKLDKTELAVAMRKAFADKKKRELLGPSQGTLFMSNSVNLATRVCVDILKAIARKITNRDEVAYVAGFTSRPTMHIRRTGTAESTRPMKSFSFIDSVTRFGGRLDRRDLETAYGRAGRSFNGQLRQNFVVLNEVDQDLLMSVGTSSATSRPGGSGASGPSGSWSKRGARGGGGGAGSGRGKGQKRPGDHFESSSAKK